MRVLPGFRAAIGAFIMVLALLVQPATANNTPADTQPLSARQVDDVERAEVTFSFFTCPDGYDPTLQDDPAGTCTTPAAMTPTISLGAPPDYHLVADDFTEIDTGVYSITLTQGWSLHFGDFFPEGSNASLVEGDGVAGGRITPMADGDTVQVYGYTQPDDVGTVAFTFLGCPEGFDPAASQDLDAYVSCTEPIEAPAGANVGDETGSFDVASAVRGTDGTYYVHDIQQPVSLTIREFEAQGTDVHISYPAEEWVRDMWSLDTTNPLTYVNVYVWDDAASSTPEEPNEPVGGGTIILSLRGCPDGLDASDPGNGPAYQCLDHITPTGDAALVWGGDQIRLDELTPDDEGTYTITGLPLNEIITLVDLEPSSYANWAAYGVDDWNMAGEPIITLVGTDVTNVDLYYYNADASTPPENEDPTGDVTVVLSLIGCPEGIDPTGVAAGTSGTEYCDNVIHATGDASLVWDGGSVRLDSLTPDASGAYTITGLPIDQTITFADLRPSNYNAWLTEGLGDWPIDSDPTVVLNESGTIYVTFYYYNEL